MNDDQQTNAALDQRAEELAKAGDPDQPTGFLVKKEMCDTCIFRPGNLMHLQSGRVRDMVDQCRATDNHIICHDTIDFAAQEDGVPGDGEAVCRGFIDAGHTSQMLRIAERFGGWTEV